LKAFIHALILAPVIALNTLESIGAGLEGTEFDTGASWRCAKEEFLVPVFAKACEVIIRWEGWNA
jgi:hypothetical protein